MKKLVFDSSKVTNADEFIKLCPFGAIEYKNGSFLANAACKMCGICVKNGPSGAAAIIEAGALSIDKSLWNGICVYVDHTEGVIHPVSFELIGKARELAKKIGHKVYCIFMGSGISEVAEELLHYGVDKVFVYDNEKLKDYITDSYTSVFEDFINRIKPCAILVGATPVGRQLAPRVAARFRTGLTADCTVLDIADNTDLIQIRPAFGGNIMAQISTPNNRPQMATVRYKIMNAPERSASKAGELVHCPVNEKMLVSKVEVLKLAPKPKVSSIENADVIVAAGRGVKSKDDLKMIEELCDVLGAEFACTRPLVECGWVEPRRQIGLSGRTVRPKLIIACGISGAVQFCAGMSNAESIFAINCDEKASIFKTANYGIVGDIYEIVPALTQMIREEK